jgi:hypothetical protein
MSYCNLIGEWEPESFKEIINTLKRHRNMLKILKKGEHILPRHIALIINFMFLDDNLCVCNVKKRSWRAPVSKYCTPKEFKEYPLHSTVMIYTQNTWAIDRILEEAYGCHVSIIVNGMKPYEDPISKSDWVVLEIPYEELLPVLISGMHDVIDSTKEVMDEYDYEDKEAYYEEIRERKSHESFDKDQIWLDISEVES